MLEARDDGRFEVRAEIEYTGGGDFLVAVGAELYNLGANALLGIELVNEAPDGLLNGVRRFGPPTL